MKISLCTGTTFRRVGYQKGLEIFKAGGFSCLDFTFGVVGEDYAKIFDDEYGEVAKTIRRRADELGIEFNQAHAPFPSYIHGNDDFNKEVYEKIVKSIEMSGILGADVIVVHPFCFPDKQNHMQENLEFFKSLIPYAKSANVKIAIENMWDTDTKRQHKIPTAFSYSEDLIEFMNLIDSEWVTVCLDLGHSCLTGREAQDEIYALKGYLGALHIHDTDYIDDLHTLCYNGDQMWDEITKALKDIGYDGDFTYECTYPHNIPNELISSYFRYMHDVAEYLVEKIEN